MSRVIFFKNKKVLIMSLSLAAFFVFVLLAQAIFSQDNGKIPDTEFSQDIDDVIRPDYIEGEVLVKFERGVDISAVDNIVDSLFINVERYFRAVSRVKGQVYVLVKSEYETTQQMMSELAGFPGVEDVSPNYRIYADTTIPNDPRFGELWGLHNTGQTGGTADVDVDAPEAWTKTTGSPGVIAAVLDTGIDYYHPDLAENVWVNPNEIKDGIDNDGNGYIDDIHGINAITLGGDPMDDNGHGTHCSGTIGAVGNNGIGVAGVNRNVKIMGVKALNSSGSGSSASAITGIDYIIDQKTTYGRNIVAINASYGGGAYNQSVKDAIDAAGQVGIIFCASAGNDGTNNDVSPHYPSSYTCPNIIAVTAVDHNGYQYYNYGLTSVDLAAPGRSILSTIQCLYTPQPGDIFFDNMESGGSLWTHGGTLDSWAVTNAASGGLENYWNDMSYGNFWSDSPGAGYVHNVDSWLAAANDIDISPYAGETIFLGFDGGFQMDYFYSNDTAVVEISKDSGSNWTTLANLRTFYYGYGYYYKKQVYIIPEAYKTANFRFRFHITTDATDYSYYGYKNKGWIIDNIGIGNDVTCDYGYKNGTSMATPHVTGAAALIAAYYPSETAAERKARLLDHVVPLPSLSGKCVSGGLLNLDLALDVVTPTLTVTSPNGGEYWETSSIQHITWTGTGTIENVKIDYSVDNGDSWIPITASTPNDGSYEWIVPDNPSDNCLIRVSDTGGDPSDVSDAVFSIVSSYSLTLISPNGGETLGVGTAHLITWDSSGTTGNVKLEYTVNNGKSWIEIVSSFPDEGSFSWTIPDNTSESCLVRVSETGGLLSDTSNAVFSIVVLPAVVVISPNGGENLAIGSYHNITWTSTGTVGNVKIEYSLVGGASGSWQGIISSTPNDGTYTWLVPRHSSRNCLVRVSEIDGDPWDVSDNVFKTHFPPYITVKSPNGGEKWQVGSIQNITWTSSTPGNVKIEYSIDSGNSWEIITTSTSNDGSYPWTIPDTPSSQCLVRVSETDGSHPDVSDGVFSIYSLPFITVTSPNGGESWKIGTTQSITWIYRGEIGNVKIEYSVDNGGSWKNISASNPNDGFYPWTIPNTPSSHCLVRVSDTAGTISDVSNGVFSIYLQNCISITSPNGGEKWEVGFSYPITWTTFGTAANVKIECSTDSGSTWRAVAASIPNTGSYSWTIPDTPSSHCLVRVSDTDGEPSDISDNTFSIFYPPTITLTSPNGGEKWLKGSSQQITWTYTGIIGSVKIRYSIDKGGSWTDITASTANTGTYNWTIPDTPSTDCLVEVSERGGGPLDISNAVFTIMAEPEAAITVISPNGGETFYTGNTHEITWTTSGTIDSMRIHYSIDSGISWKPIVESTENDGSYNWLIPHELSDNCLVRIAGEKNDNPSDTSDVVFSIISPSITVIFPNGGESLTTGSVQLITWTFTGIVGNVAIDYSIDNGTSWTVIVDSTENDGSYPWTIPGDPSNISDNCLVRIRESDNDATPSDTSNGKFSIIAPLYEVITVTSPNGGETLYTGSGHEITWTAPESIANVEIAYSMDNGVTWTGLTASTPNNGSYSWTIPQSPSDQCLIRISDAEGEGFDVSDEVFSIALPASITVISPNGGEILYAGSTYEITWTTSGTIDKVTLEYSVNGGKTWIIIAASTANDGSYSWLVPVNPSDNCLVRVRDDESDKGVWDVSDVRFTIDASAYTAITVIAPNGGETLYAGSTFDITWASSGITGNVKIEYSTDNGISWTEVTGATDNDGNYTWAVPGTPSLDCLVRVSGRSEDSSPVSDESDAVFEISAETEPTVTVISPNGGETIYQGSTFEITWTNTGSIDRVTLEYSIDGGTSWTYIANSAANDGSYQWTVPETPLSVNSNCLVRITGADGDLGPSDVSDDVFSITKPMGPTITVVSPNGGERLTVGSIHEITWTGSEEIVTIMIEYSTDNGRTWIIIAEPMPNEGSFEWTVPDNPSDHCRVRIQGNDKDNHPFDTSDAEFSIIPWSPQVTVTYPNGGEVFYGGLWQEITWTASDIITNVKIEYSTDNGITWEEIITSTPNDGHLQFIVPESPSETCLVRVSDTDGNPSDVSDAVFTIEPDLYKCGYGGFSYERNPDGSIGPIIPWVEITFVSEDGSFTRKTTTNGSGYYRVPLPPQRYVVTAVHPDFLPYSSSPGFFVVPGDGYHTGNFFLTRK